MKIMDLVPGLLKAAPDHFFLPFVLLDSDIFHFFDKNLVFPRPLLDFIVFVNFHHVHEFLVSLNFFFIDQFALEVDLFLLPEDRLIE